MASAYKNTIKYNSAKLIAFKIADIFLNLFRNCPVKAPMTIVDLSLLTTDALLPFVRKLHGQKLQFGLQEEKAKRLRYGIHQYLEILGQREKDNFLSAEEIHRLQELQTIQQQLSCCLDDIVKNVNAIDFVETHSEEDISDEDISSEMSEEEDVSMEEQKEPPSTSWYTNIDSLEKEASGCKTTDYDMENKNFEIESKERHCEATDLSPSCQQKITCTLEKMHFSGPSLEDYLKNNFNIQGTIEPTTNPIPFSIERAALGRKAVLGDFYDACRDTFVGGNIFNRGWPEEQIGKPRPMFSSRMLDENRVSNKVDVINTVGIEDELLLSFLTLNVQVSGSAELLNEKRNFVESTHNVVTLKMKTHMEMVNLAQAEYLKFIGEPKNLNGATHVVVGIEKGCHTYVDISSKDTPVQFEQTETQFPAVEIKVFSDMPSGSPPSRVEDIKEFLDKIAHEAEYTYQQVPIGYIMLDIKEVARLLNWTLRRKTNYKPLSKQSVEKCLEILRNAEGIYKSFNVEREKLNEIAGEQFKSKEQYNLRFKRILKRKMGDLIRQSREDQKNEKTFEKLGEGEFSPIFEAIADEFFPHNKQFGLFFKMYQRLKKYNVKFFATKEDLHAVYAAQFATVLTYSIQHLNEDIWNSIDKFVEVCQSADPTTVLAAVNKDGFSETEMDKFQGVRIVYINNVKNVSSLLVTDHLGEKFLAPTEGETKLLMEGK